MTKNSPHKIIFFTICAVLVGVGLASLAFGYLSGPHFFVRFPDSQSETASVANNPFASGPMTIMPKYFYVNKGNGPVVSAKAFVVGDLDTGEIIASKNAEQKYPLA